MNMPAINLRRTLLIARRDYFGYIKTWGFWISFFLPFIIGVIVMIAIAMGVNVSPTKYETILDETGLHGAAILQKDKDKNDAIIGTMLTGLGKTVLNETDAEKLETIIDTDGVDAGKAFLDQKIPGTSEQLKAVDSKLIFVAPPVDNFEDLKSYLVGDKMVTYEGEEVKLSGALHIYDDGDLTADYWSSNVTNNPVRNLARDYFKDKSGDTYLQSGNLNLEDYKIARDESLKVTAFDPTKKETLDGKGQAVTMKDRVPYLVAFGLSMFLWMTVFSGAYMLLTSMLEEKMNKLLEMMLATTRFSEIILGKLLGVAGLTITAILPYIVMGVVGVIGFILYGDPEIAQGLVKGFNPQMIIFFLFFLVLGYVFYGSLFIALGALAESMQDAQTLTTPITFVLMGCMFIVTIGLESPDSPLLVFASWFPLSAPFAMIMRLPTNPPLWQLCLSVGLLMACTLGVVLVSGRIFRYGILSGAGVKVATDWFKRTILRRKTT